MFVVGSTFGEAVIPVCIGAVMHFTGPQALMYCTLTISVIMVSIYFVAHHLLLVGHPKDDVAMDGSSRHMPVPHSQHIIGSEPPIDSREYSDRYDDNDNAVKSNGQHIELVVKNDSRQSSSASEGEKKAHPGLVDGNNLYLA